MSHEGDVQRRLQEVFELTAAEERDLDLDSARIVILSDQHKGQRDGADDLLASADLHHDVFAAA